MQWWHWLLIYLFYVIVSFVWFLYAWRKRGKRSGHWTDHIWAPGVLPIAFVIGYTTHIIEKTKDWRKRK